MRPLFYGLRGVFLFDFVVEEAGGVGRGHEAAVDLGIDADVLVDLSVGHLDLERLRSLVIADRTQLRGIDALAVHGALSTLILSPALIFFSRAKSFIVPRTLHGLASFGRASVEMGVRPKGRARASPCVQKHAVPGSTTCCASASSLALTGVSKYTSSPQVCARPSKGAASNTARDVVVSLRSMVRLREPDLITSFIP